MENTDKTRSYIIDMLEAKGMTGSGLAVLSGVSKVNTLRWLKGQGQSLGAVGVGKLLTALGVLDGQLDPARVHYFRIKSEQALSCFSRILNLNGEGKTTFQMALIAPEKSAFKDFLTLGAVTPVILWSPSLRIIIRNALFSKSLADDLIESGLARWRTDLPKDEYYSHPTVRVTRPVFDSLENQAFVSSLELDRILPPPSSLGIQENQAIEWEAVVEAFKAAGFSPKEALSLIPSSPKKKKPEK